MAKSAKYYVVWEGHEPGIYTSWNECQRQIKNYKNAKYKSFKTKEAALEAYGSHYSEYYGKKVFETELSKEQLEKIGEPIRMSIAVDGAGNNNTGVVEYRGVFVETGTQLFHKGPLQGGTNNIVEFLALVHALAYCKKHHINYPIYSDSRIAMGWVRAKTCRTKQPINDTNQRIFSMVRRAESWLRQNTYANKILKWETKAWGEIPADFGRK